jgi:hypothetical protein
MGRYHRIAALIVAMGMAIQGAGQTAANDSEAQQLMNKVRETYAGLMVWHFEHRISIEETEGVASPVKLADITLITANAASQGNPGGISIASFCRERCRLEASATGRPTTILVLDGTTTWMYSPQRGEYMKGAALRDVSGSRDGGTLLLTHISPLEVLGAESWIASSCGRRCRN